MIKLININKKFEDQIVFSNLNMLFDKGYYCIKGDSGKGKTTIFNLLAGFIKPDNGEIIFNDDTRISIVFQENRLLEDFDIYTNILLPHINKKSVKDINRQIIDKHLSQVGLSDYDGKLVKDFSGGMKRRVELIRALLSDYNVLLLDEPFTGLDQQTKILMMDHIKKCNKDKLVIFITHDQFVIDYLKPNKVYFL